MSKDWKSVERQIARLFDSWFHQKSGTIRRTPMSGAWDKQKYPGDIYIPDSLSIPAVFEVKTESKWGFEKSLSDDLLPNPRSAAFIKYQYQVFKDAYPGRKIPILLLTKARCPVYMGFPTVFYRALQSIHPSNRPAELRVRNDYMDWTFVLMARRLGQDAPEPWVAVITPDLIRKVRKVVVDMMTRKMQTAIEDYEANKPVRRKRNATKS